MSDAARPGVPPPTSATMPSAAPPDRAPPPPEPTGASARVSPPPEAAAASDLMSPPRSRLTASEIVARLLADPRLNLRLARDLQPGAGNRSQPHAGPSGVPRVAEPRPAPLSGDGRPDKPPVTSGLTTETGRPPRETSGNPSAFLTGDLAAACVAIGIPDCAERLLRGLEYVVVDVETTGGSAPLGHRITEFAAVRIAWDGTLLDEYTTLVNPERPIPPFVSALTNITWEMVRDAPRFADIAGDVARILKGAVFVAHNAAFDWRFVSHELAAVSGVTPEAPRLCTVRLARKVVPEVASRSLDALTYFFGLANLARHRAYGDARVTADLLLRLLDRVEEREISSWRALDELVGKRKPRKPRRRQAMPSGMDPSDIPAQ